MVDLRSVLSKEVSLGRSRSGGVFPLDFRGEAKLPAMWEEVRFLRSLVHGLYFARQGVL